MKKLWKYFWIAVKGTETKFTQGSIKKALFLLAIPMILEMVMEALFAVVDMFFVSRLGSEDAIATIGLTESFLFVVISLALGVASATIAVVSRRTGEEDYEEASRSGAQAIMIGVLVGLSIGVIGYFYTPELLRLMGSSEALVDEGTAYTRIILSLNVILILLFVNNAIFRAVGDATIAMRTLWYANGLNMILDPCFIFGLGFFPEMGLEGAAVATCIGRGCGVLYQFYHMFNGKNLVKMIKGYFVPVWPIILKLLKLTLGGAGQHILTSCSWLFMVYIINQFGSAAMSGYTIAMRIIMFTILPSWGLAMAASTLVGQNLGAGQPDRAEKSAWTAAFYNMVFLTTISIIFFIFAKPLVGIFSENSEVIRHGALGLQIICAGYIFFAYEMVIGQCFNGAGDTFTPTFLNFIAFWILQVPLAYFLAIYLDMGPTGVYIAIAICSSILALMAVVIFRKGKWKTISV